MSNVENRYTVTVLTQLKKDGGGERKIYKGIKATTKQEACDRVAEKMGGYHGALSVKRTS